MSLRNELKEAMAVAEEEAHSPRTARRIRAEDCEVSCLEFGFGLVTREVLLVAQAVLSVCDEYEEVKVQESDFPGCLWLSDNPHWKPHRPSFTIYRKGQKPEPAVTVSRETLAVLLEFARNVPNKDEVLDRACTEADRKL